MDHKNLESKIIERQNQYIKALEEQLDVYQKKDKAQQDLIENMDQALQIFADEISRLKEESGKSDEKRT